MTEPLPTALRDIHHAKVSDILQEFIDTHAEAELPVSALVHAFGERGMAFLLLVFALICAIPLPIPGIHMFLSLPLFYISFYQMIGRTEIWLPKKIMDYKLPRQAFTDISLKALPWIRKVENISKPRLNFLNESFFYCFFGFVIFFITAVLSIPLWLTNFVPAIAISLMALGLLMKDGLAVIAGTVLGLLWCVFLFFLYIALVAVGLQHAIAFFTN